ncbi:MAG: TetR/AcrR family transcriptional regulator [Nocardioidaceae bacterium]
MARARPASVGRATGATDAAHGDRVPDGGVARRRILDAAEHLIARDGFDATPTARIAALAEVPKGLVFYYFPRKIELLRSLLAERLPTHPLLATPDVVLRGDVAGSLLRLARGVDLSRAHSPVLATILFREAGTHPEVARHLRTMHEGLLELTEQVLDAAALHPLNHRRRREAAETYVAVLLHEANSRRYDGPVPDLGAVASIVSSGLDGPA